MYFKQSSFMVLDFDNGNLSPDDFVRIFWREAKRGHKRSFVICNSFSRSPEKPNSFRVIMFYKRPATTIDQHKAILASIVHRLEQNGFSADSAKLDPNCKSGIQSFYLPCTNKAHETWAFFEKYGTKTRDLERCAIDPADYEATPTPRETAPRMAEQLDQSVASHSGTDRCRNSGAKIVDHGQTSPGLRYRPQVGSIGSFRECSAD